MVLGAEVLGDGPGGEQVRRVLEADGEGLELLAAPLVPAGGDGGDEARVEATGEEGAKLLARSNVAAVLLPACALFLDLPLPPARTLIEEGAVVALATDFNPGSSFCESLPLVMSLACTRLKMSPAEALGACTANAAHVLGLSGEVGRLAPGYQADVLVLDASDWRYLAYHLGGDRFATRIKSGQPLGSNSRLL